MDGYPKRLQVNLCYHVIAASGVNWKENDGEDSSYAKLALY